MAGPLASLLMGVGNRAAEHSMRDEQRSYDEASQGRKLANEALMKMLEDPSRTYEEQQSIAGQIETNNKMKAGSLKDAFKFATQLHPHLERAIQQNQQPLPSMPSIPQMGEEAPSASMQYEPAVTIQGGALQGQQAPAMVQPTQTKALPNTQQMPPMPQPPVGMNPQGQSAQFQSGTQQQAPRSEMERKQQAVAQSVRQHMEDLKSLNLPPEVLQDAIRAGVGIPPSVQAAQVGADSRRDVAKINAVSRSLTSGAKGQFVTYQGEGAPPRTLFQVTSGAGAGKVYENGQETQIQPGERAAFNHPDKIEAIQDPDTKEITYHNISKQLGGKEKVNIGPGQRLGAGASANAGELTPEGLKMAAEQFAKTGQMPAMGMGAAGIRTQIINEAAKLYPNVDLGSNKAAYTANQASLTQMQKNRDAVVTWESTALKNLKIFEDAAKPIIDSGSPLINIPLRLASQKAVGSKEMAAFNTARTVALTEIAKVLNNPNLTGQLTNEARAEAMAMAPATATLGQIYAVVDILKRDMKNRHDELDATVDAIHERIGRGPNDKVSSSSEKRGLGNPPPPPTSLTGVKMKAPDGSMMSVPSELVEKYKKKGATIVQ